MKNIARILLILFLVILPASAVRGHGPHGGSHVGIGFYMGPSWDPWWGGPPYYSYYSPYYRYYPYYEPPTVIIQEEPEIYVKPNPPAEGQKYWYYCKESKGYYPNVKKCPKGWMKVVPPEQPPEGEE